MVQVLQENRHSIAELCQRFGVLRLDVFGSALRDDYRPGQSDLDLLVEFQAMEPRALADAYFGLLDELRQLLGSRLDLVMADAVKNRVIAHEIERTKQLFYAA